MPLCFMLSLSPATQYSSDDEDLICASCRNLSDKCFVVREYGKRGDHPHLHVILKLHTERRSDSLRKSIVKTEMLHGDAKELKVSAMRDTPEQLIAKYLSKDDNRVILYNDLVDLDTLPPPRDEFIYDVLVGTRNITPGEAPLLIIKYCEEKEIDVPTSAFQYWQMMRRLAHENYQVYNCIKNGKTILRTINAYVSEDEQCYDVTTVYIDELNNKKPQ